MRIDYSSEYEGCYVCGKNNPLGMKLDFTCDHSSGEMVARYSFDEYMQGYSGIVHGGFISMLLDEVMAKACLNRKYAAVTARIEVRFKKPVYVNEEVTLRGRVVSVKGKKILTESFCLDPDGLTRASASALFLLTDG